MTLLIVGERNIELDEHGYLLNPDDWDMDVAQTLVNTIDIQMTDDHWMVVKFVRDWYEEKQAVPEARHALKAMKEALGKDKATRKYLYQLFP
ncbi:unnamed protein product, partial [Cyprideis torosa]